MVFSYSPSSGTKLLKVEGESFRHLFLSRRSKSNERFLFRNLKDNFLYEYKAVSIGKKDALLELVGKEEDGSSDFVGCEIAWCVVDPKTVEKTLSSLNELGVKRLFFIYSSRSQKNFKIDTQRIERIVINSCCQCGRTDLMEIEVLESLDEFCALKKEFYVFDFGGERVGDIRNGLFLIGPEGGFSLEEKALLKREAKKVLSFASPTVLRSETAVLSAASLAIL